MNLLRKYHWWIPFWGLYYGMYWDLWLDKRLPPHLPKWWDLYALAWNTLFWFLITL